MFSYLCTIKTDNERYDDNNNKFLKTFKNNNRSSSSSNNINIKIAGITKKQQQTN